MSPWGTPNSGYLAVREDGIAEGNVHTLNIGTGLSVAVTDGVATVTGDTPHNPVTLAAVGSAPCAAGASLVDQVLTLQPADGTNPGVVTAGTQTIGGVKTFTSGLACSLVSGDAFTQLTSTRHTFNVAGTSYVSDLLGVLSLVSASGVVNIGATGIGEVGAAAIRPAVTGSALSYTSRISDGASAIAHAWKCGNPLSTSGAKIGAWYKDDGSTLAMYLGITSSGNTSFYVGNSSTDNLTLGGNPRFYLKCPPGINGMRFDTDAQPVQISALDSGGVLTGSAWAITGTVGDGTQRLACQAANATASATMKDTPIWYLTAKRWTGSASATAFQGYLVGEVYSTSAPYGGMLVGTTGSVYGVYYVRNDGLVGIGVKGASLAAGLHYLCGVADGASAIATLSDTSSTWSTAGAKLHSWKNNGTEKAFLAYDGRGSFSGGLSPGTAAGAEQTGRIFQGSGVPSDTNGADGDIYFDTARTSSHTMYQRLSGTWTALI